MKKSFLVFMAGILAAALAPSQLRAEIDFNLGIKSGISLSKISITGWTFPNVGKPVFGVFFSFGLSERFAVQPEAYLLTQGMNDEGFMGTGILVRREYILSYIHVPVLAKLRILNKGRLIPVVFAGPAMDFMMRAVQRVYYDRVFDHEDDIKFLYKNTNIGLVIGAGAEFSMEKVFLVLDVRYDQGLTNIDALFVEIVKTRAIFFMVGVGF